MTTATIIEEIIPLQSVPRGATGLPENCFQQFYVLYIDGRECCGADKLESLATLAEGIYGLDIRNLPISETVFAGW